MATLLDYRAAVKPDQRTASNSHYGLASCRLARQGREIGWKSMLFQPISSPATQGRGGLKAIITIAGEQQTVLRSWFFSGPSGINA